MTIFVKELTMSKKKQQHPAKCHREIVNWLISFSLFNYLVDMFFWKKWSDCSKYCGC